MAARKSAVVPVIAEDKIFEVVNPKPEYGVSDPVAALKHLRLALASPEMKPANKAIAQKDYAEAYDKSGHVAVLATESTVNGGAYERAILARRADARVYSQACSLFVALAEEGWIQGSLVKSVVKEYLYPLLREKKREGLDCLVLGCTHFPLLKDTIADVAGSDMKLVDSGETVAAAVERMLPARKTGSGSARYLATDGAERFARVGSLFLGESIEAHDVEIVDL